MGHLHDWPRRNNEDGLEGCNLTSCKWCFLLREFCCDHQLPQTAIPLSHGIMGIFFHVWQNNKTFYQELTRTGEMAQKNTYCFCRGPGVWLLALTWWLITVFNSSSGHRTPSSGLWGYQLENKFSAAQKEDTLWKEPTKHFPFVKKGVPRGCAYTGKGACPLIQAQEAHWQALYKIWLASWPRRKRKPKEQGPHQDNHLC